MVLLKSLLLLFCSNNNNKVDKASTVIVQGKCKGKRF